MNQNQLNQARGMVYQLLSSLFAKEIDDTLMAQLTSADALNFWANLGNDPKLEDDVKQIVATLTSIKSENDLLELAADYCSLFLVGGKHSANPYASLYLTDEDADKVNVFGEQHHLMSQFLKQSKLEVKSDFPEPADHIAVILSYVNTLCTNSDQAKQLEFIQNLLGTWVDHFAQRVAAKDQGKFYSHLSHLTQNWIAGDLDWLQEETKQSA